MAGGGVNEVRVPGALGLGAGEFGLIAALSLVGYVATRALGPRRGTAVTGLSGGLVSSTAITLAFAKQSREEGGRTDDVLAGGLLLAWAVMGVRILVIVAVVFAPLVRPLLMPFGAMTVATLAAVAFLLRRARTQEPAAAGEVGLKNPFSLTSAAKFRLLFAVVLVVVAAVERYIPGRGYYLVAALSGLTDVDAITLSMASGARKGSIAATTAAHAIVIAMMEEYVALAVRLGREPELLATTRAKLAANRATQPLFDTERFRKHIEAAYVAMWERVQRGEPPDHLTIAPIT